MKLQEFKEELLKKSSFKKEYERFDLWFEIGMKWVEFKMWLSVLKGKVMKELGKE